MTLALFIDILGWYGALVVLLAYGLISSGRLEGRSRWYQWLNIQGSVCLLVNTAYHHAFPSAFVNLIWALIGITAWLVYSKPPSNMSPVGSESPSPTEPGL